VDYGLLWITMDCHGLWNIPRPLKAKAVTTAQRYGASHTLSQSCIIMDYGLSRIIVDYHGLWIIVDYDGLAKFLMNYGLP
jgi:hypothetical protein